MTYARETDPLVLGETFHRADGGHGQIRTLFMRTPDASGGGGGGAAGELDRIALDYIDTTCYTLLLHGGCYTADEAVRRRCSGGGGLSDGVKLEVIGVLKTLFPRYRGAFRANAGQGRVRVLSNDDPIMARKLEDAGAAAVMPLGAPIGREWGSEPRQPADYPGNRPSPSSSMPVGTADASLALELHEAKLMNAGIAEAKDLVAGPANLAGGRTDGVQGGAIPETLRHRQQLPEDLALDQSLPAERRHVHPSGTGIVKTLTDLKGTQLSRRCWRGGACRRRDAAGAAGVQISPRRRGQRHRSAAPRPPAPRRARGRFRPLPRHPDPGRGALQEPPDPGEDLRRLVPRPRRPPLLGARVRGRCDRGYRRFRRRHLHARHPPDGADDAACPGGQLHRGKRGSTSHKEEPWRLSPAVGRHRRHRGARRAPGAPAAVGLTRSSSAAIRSGCSITSTGSPDICRPAPGACCGCGTDRGSGRPGRDRGRRRS